MASAVPLSRGIARLACVVVLGVVCFKAFLHAGVGPWQTPPGQAAPPAQPAVGTCLILGQVVDPAGSGVAGVVVTLSGGLVQMGGFNINQSPTAIPGGPRRTITSASGRFVFADLPQGSYSIDATKPGYLPGAFGRHRPGGIQQSLTLAEDERNGTVKITVWKYASISGTVTDDAGEPLVGAEVAALRRSYDIGRVQMSPGSSGVTDDRGWYRISSLTPGDYVISVTATQVTVPVALVEAYAQARLAGTTADFSRQMSASGFGFAMSAMTGGVRVGDFVLQTSGPYSRGGAVPPEPAEDGRLLSFQTTFYPGVFGLAQADVIALASGDERVGTNIQLKLVPTAPVAGTIVGPDGPVANLGVRLVPGYASDLSFEERFDSATTMTDANGAFRFLGVPVGPYSIRAIKVPVSPPPPPPTSTTVIQSGSGGSLTMSMAPPVPPAPPPLPEGPTLWASVPIVVDADGASDVLVRLNGGFRISGRFEFDGTIAKPPPSIVQTLSVLMQPIDGHQAGFASALRARVDPNGTFTTYEIPPGKYSIRMAAPTTSWLAMPGWTFRSSVVDGKDIAATPLDVQGAVSGIVITMTDHPSEISGTVRDDKGRVDPTAAVIVFSADRADWTGFGETPRRLRHLRVSRAGVYRVFALPAGQYLVAAIPDAEAGDWGDPRFLAALSRTAVRINLGDGEKRTQDVVTRSVR